MKSSEEVAQELITQAEAYEAEALKLRGAAAVLTGDSTASSRMVTLQGFASINLSTRDLVMDVMSAKPIRPWTLPQVYEEIERRGVLPPIANPREAIRQTLHRFLKQEVAWSPARGQFQVKSSESPAPSGEAE